MKTRLEIPLEGEKWKGRGGHDVMTVTKMSAQR